jgi:arabinofuranan 3-O-arabinosyltransferase
VSGRQLTPAIWALALLSLGTSLVPIVDGVQGYDTVPLWNAIRGLLEGGAVYTARGSGDFLYPPSALLLLLPLGFFGLPWAGRIFFFVDLLAILAATLLVLDLFGLRWRGVAGALAVLALSFTWPVLLTLEAGNANGPILLGLAVFLYTAARNSWVLAGASLGVTLALKPVLAPLILVVVLYRRWWALAPAIGIPVGLSVAVMLVSAETREYFDITLPLLLEGQDASVQRNSIALESVLDRFGVPLAIVQGTRLAILAATIALVWRRWREDDAEPRRLVEVVSLILIGSFLLSSFAFVHYGIFLIPLAVSLAEPSSPHRNWLMFGALFAIAARESWHLDLLPDDVNRVLIERFTFGLLLVLLAFWFALRRGPSELISPPVATNSEAEPSVGALRGGDAVRPRVHTG